MKINPDASAGAARIFDAAPIDTLGYRGTQARAVQDNMLRDAGIYDMIGQGRLDTFPQFIGYGALSMLTQNGVIRVGVEMRADEMTRRWIDFNYDGEAGEEYADSLMAEVRRFRVDTLLRDAAQMCGYFGGCLAYIDVGDISNDDLRLPLGSDSDTFKKGSLRGFKLIEPFNVSPGRYSCYNPLDKDYFVPQSWLVMGREIHATRFLYFAEGKPPTLLLPSYNFFGVPLAQTVMDSVHAFQESAAATARLLQKFSCTVFGTNMDDILTGGLGTQIQRRIAVFAKQRDNDGVMTIDNETERIENVSAPLGGVTDIVRQQMEIVAAYFGEPSVKMWGISPGGFNATGESDMRSHYDHVNALQEQILRAPLEYALRLLQLNKSGRVDDALTFEFVPLSNEDQKLQAEVQRLRVDAMTALFDRGIIDGMEARHRLAEDPDSGFADIDETKEIEPPDVALPFGDDGEAGDDDETGSKANP